MGFMKKKRIRQILKYGWKDAGEIASFPDVKKSRFSIFLDIWHNFRKHYLFSNQYKSNKFWSLDESTRLVLANKIGNENRTKDEWIDVHYSDWKFLSKYTSLKWQNTPKRTRQRTNAYIKHYGLGENCSVQYGVTIICEHYSKGKITCGKRVLLARDCDIDYTGDIEIGDNVGILEGAKILTHAHDSYHFMKESDLIPFSNRAYKTNLKIGKNVSICAHAIILPGVREIGENSIISAGAIVNRPVPANVIVAGNPAEVVRKIPAVVKRTKH